MRTTRAGLVIGHVEVHEIEELLQGRHHVNLRSVAKEGHAYGRESWIVLLAGATKQFVAEKRGLDFRHGQILDQHFVGNGLS